ncbi:MAG: CoA synthetase [Proteobacteria bacterium]|nr:CoA synthetase [Pseudomonadota bacterium]
MTRTVALDDLVRRIKPGAKVAVAPDYAGPPMATIRELIRQGTGDLHVVCVPSAGMVVDVLLGTGQVRTLETAAITLGEAGGAPRFQAALKQGSIRIMDATCPAIHAGLLAAQKGVPFVPLRGIIGTDVLANRPDWKVIQNPFADAEDPIVLIPAILPDIAIFHAPVADRFGNVQIGRRRELASMAYAAKSTLVTVERITDENLLHSELSAAAVLPSLYVDAVAVVPEGAKPYGMWSGEYDVDPAEVAQYARVARTEDGFRDYLARFLGATVPA